ncbi:hypothetical protein BC937DRAFT_94774, partial [Endogone sp. FLAS-F59071]
MSSSPSSANSPTTSFGSTPSTPTTPTTPKSRGSANANPLTELIESEKEYVETLRVITQVNDMEAPYANFSRSFVKGLNERADIMSNPELQMVLTNLSLQREENITLDTLFASPLERMRYYKKLYVRLLESTEPGRSDHKLLMQANHRIDMVLLMAQKTVSTPKQPPLPVSQPTTPTSVASSTSAVTNSDLAASAATATAAPSKHVPPRLDLLPPNKGVVGAESTPNATSVALNSPSSAPAESPIKSPRGPLSPGQARISSPVPPSPGQGPLPSPSQPREETGSDADRLAAFEKSVDTTRVVDLFTKQPRKCKLQLASPSRCIVIRENFTLLPPEGTAVPSVRAHVLLLTDLFMVCQRMTEDERIAGQDKELWLLYPPLASKHLSMRSHKPERELIGEYLIEVIILKKISLILRAVSRETKSTWLDT